MRRNSIFKDEIHFEIRETSRTTKTTRIRLRLPSSRLSQACFLLPYFFFFPSSTSPEREREIPFRRNLEFFPHFPGKKSETKKVFCFQIHSFFSTSVTQSGSPVGKGRIKSICKYTFTLSLYLYISMLCDVG